jgi:uncharacterized membrane protein YuzA (DUF378 family)
MFLLLICICALNWELISIKFCYLSYYLIAWHTKEIICQVYYTLLRFSTLKNLQTKNDDRMRHCKLRPKIQGCISDSVRNVFRVWQICFIPSKCIFSTEYV